MDFPLIEAAVVYAIMAIACFITSIFEKNYKYLCYIIGFTSLSGTILCAINLCVQSAQLNFLCLGAPIGVLLVLLGLNTIINYNTCTETVEAECIGYISGKHKHVKWKFPKFRYFYKGVSYESVGLVSYPPKQFDKLFEKRNIIIYINPKKPTRCADKLSSPVNKAVKLIVLGGLFIALSLIFCLI